MKRRGMAGLACAALLLAALAGCGGKSRIFRYDLPGDPRSLDPQTASDRAAQVVIGNVYEGLTALDAAGEVRLAAAQSCTEAPDGLSYEFELRPDAQWSYYAPDGSVVQAPLTAADFVFAFRRLFSPNTNSAGTSRFFCLKNGRAVWEGERPPEDLGVRAVGPYTLRFTLDTPNGQFLELLATTYAMPCYEPFFQSTMGRYGLAAGTTLSNGPFRVTQWESGSLLRLAKSGSYRAADTVLPEEVRLSLDLRDGTGAGTIERLDQGEVDAALVDGRADGLAGHGYRTEPLENAVWGVWLNQKNPVLANENIRRAIAKSFDRSVYAQELPPNLRAAYALLPHDTMLDGKSYRAAAGDVLTAAFAPGEAYELYKQGLTELAKNSAGELRLLVDEAEGQEGAACFAKVSQVLQRELSLFVGVEAVDAREYAARLAAGDFDMALCRLQSFENSPWSILSNFLSASPANPSGYVDEEFDRLLAAASAQPEQALSLYSQAEERLLASAVYLPMYYSTDYFVVRPGIRGIVYNKQTGLVDFRAAETED